MEEKAFPDEADFIRNEGNLFFFHLVAVDDTMLAKETMVNFTKNEKNVIFFDIKQRDNMSTLLHNAICRRFSNKTCKAVPNDVNMKCQLIITAMIDGCYKKDEIVPCDEKYCQCDEMYPLDSQCSSSLSTCKGPMITVNRRRLDGSTCPTSVSCFKDCPSIPFNRLKQAFLNKAGVLRPAEADVADRGEMKNGKGCNVISSIILIILIGYGTILISVYFLCSYGF